MKWNRPVDWIVSAGAIVVASFLLIAEVNARHWPLVHDAPLMHYIVFLMSKGFAPYRDIIDMNMPGSYLFDSFAIHTFGGGAGGWFAWDLLFVVLAVLACAWIAGPLHRSAGILAGSFASLTHLSDGAWNLGQRDWVVTVLLLLSFACLFHFLRGGHTAWIAGVIFCASLAASIKPPALLPPLVALSIVFGTRRKSHDQMAAIALWALAGAAVPSVIVVTFLLKWDAVGSFIAASRGLVPYYASLQNLGIKQLLWSSLYVQLRLLGVAVLVLFWMNRSWRSLESILLLAGTLSGVSVYLLQGKGWSYHQYPIVAFLALWLMLEIEKALRSDGVRAWIAAATLTVVILIFTRDLLVRQQYSAYPTGTMLHLESDLAHLGGAQLSGHVQCLDMTLAGCINVLYRLHIAQPTGFIYDYYLFPEHATTVTLSLQNQFLEQVRVAPPQIFVLSQQIWPGDTLGYQQLARWPSFDRFIAERYRLAEEYVRASGDTVGYRLYVLK